MQSVWSRRVEHWPYCTLGFDNVSVDKKKIQMPWHEKTLINLR